MSDPECRLSLYGPTARDGRVPGEIRLERVQIPDVIHAFLEAPDVARGQADPLHAQPPQLPRDEQVLGVGGGGVGLVDGDFELEGTTDDGRRTTAAIVGRRSSVVQVPVHRRHVRHGAAIFDRRPQQRCVVVGDGAVFDLDALADVGRAQSDGAGFQSEPGQRVVLAAQRCCVVGIGRAIHVLAGVDGEEGEAGGRACVDIGGRLQVIGVRAHASLPAFLESAPGGVIHHLLRGAAGARHLADGLLGEDRRDVAADRSHGLHVARRRQPQPVAHPRGGAQAERMRLQPGEVRSQRSRIARAGWSEQQRLARQRTGRLLAGLTLEIGQDGRASRREHCQPRPICHLRQCELGPAAVSHRIGVHCQSR